MGISHLFVVIVDLFFAESRCISGDEVTGSVQFSSVAQLCLTLCDPMNCSTPGLPGKVVLAYNIIQPKGGQS